MNARIWEYINDDYVKITLRPGQCLVWGRFGRDEEGWSSETTRWEWDGTTLTFAFCMDGTDCDGRTSSHGCFKTTRDKFAMKDTYPPGEICVTANGAEVIHLPEWEKVSDGRRDYSAEAAGY